MLNSINVLDMEFIKERYNVLINTYLGVKFITNQILGYCKYGKNNLKVIFEIDIFSWKAARVGDLLGI